jgi:hypothetical protein
MAVVLSPPFDDHLKWSSGDFQINKIKEHEALLILSRTAKGRPVNVTLLAGEYPPFHWKQDDFWSDNGARGRAELILDSLVEQAAQSA